MTIIYKNPNNCKPIFEAILENYGDMDDNQKRLSRVTAILTLLLSKRLITATEISKRFKISVRTVYRDIRALEGSGVPVRTEEGRGYSIGEGYRLPPVMFTEREALALVTGEQILLRNKDASLAKTFSDGISKIRSILRNTDQQKSQLLSDRIYIAKNSKSEPTSKSLLDIQIALTNHQLVRILYKTLQDPVCIRIIEPFAIYNNPREEWTIAAYCRLQKKFCSFRLDWIIAATILDAHFEPHKMTLKQCLRKYL
jgi:predicted DNA-binding transcriptional regulator YafY